MNISSAILNMYKISDMTMGEYQEFLESSTGRSKKYRIKLQTNKNGILMQNLRNGKTFMLECVKSYYSPCTVPLTGINNCFDCRTRLNIPVDLNNCLDCHRYCFEQYNKRQMNKVMTNKVKSK